MSEPDEYRLEIEAQIMDDIFRTGILPGSDSTLREMRLVRDVLTKEVEVLLRNKEGAVSTEARTRIMVDLAYAQRRLAHYEERISRWQEWILDPLYIEARDAVKADEQLPDVELPENGL